jgi:hypothetical protein
MSNFFFQYFCNFNANYSIIIEDDNRVAYAYLLEGENIVGDVWLYNQEQSPVKENWDNPDDLPFLNSLDYIIRKYFPHY